MEQTKSTITATPAVQISARIYEQEMRTISHYFGGDLQKVTAFCSEIRRDITRNPDIAKCSFDSIVQAYLTMAELGFFPSQVSGEAYVLPRKIKGVMTAVFQIGYQGLVSLMLSAGCRSIRAVVVREHDHLTVRNGLIDHEYSLMAPTESRGEPVAVYVIIILPSGEELHHPMRKDDILALAERYSASYKYESSPWNPKNDLELWMWKKTVLIQAAKLAPKNAKLQKAIHEDYRDSVISDKKEKEESKKDRLQAALSAGEDLKNKALLIHNTPTNVEEEPLPQEQ